MGNPFKEETGDLLSLDTKDIASPDSAARIATRLSTGKASFEARLEALEQEDTSSFYPPIKKTNDARLELCAREQRSYQGIPPTQAALVQHIRCAAYQVACIWRQAFVCQSEEDSPAEWGGKQEGDCWSIP